MTQYAWFLSDDLSMDGPPFEPIHNSQSHWQAGAVTFNSPHHIEFSI